MVNTILRRTKVDLLMTLRGVIYVKIQHEVQKLERNSMLTYRIIRRHLQNPAHSLYQDNLHRKFGHQSPEENQGRPIVLGMHQSGQKHPK